MAAEIAPRSVPQRAHEELLAVVDGGRVLLVSQPLLDLTGYSRGQTASPEFRPAYLLHPGSSDAAHAAEPGRGELHDVLLSPPGGPPERFRVVVHSLALPAAPGARALLFLRDETDDPEALADRAMRAVVASLRSALAEPMHRLRRVDEALAALSALPREALGEALPSLLPACEAQQGFDGPLRAIERSVHLQATLRHPFQRR